MVIGSHIQLFPGQSRRHQGRRHKQYETLNFVIVILKYLLRRPEALKPEQILPEPSQRLITAQSSGVQGQIKQRVTNNS